MNSVTFKENQVIMRGTGNMCLDPADIAYTELFKTALKLFMARLRSHDAHLLELFPTKDAAKQDELATTLLQKLVDAPLQEVIKQHPEFKEMNHPAKLIDLVEAFYTDWLNHERYFICDVDDSEVFHKEGSETFDQLISKINYHYRRMYRIIAEHILHTHPRVYRQVPAGCQVGMIVSDHHDTLKGTPYAF